MAEQKEPHRWEPEHGVKGSRHALNEFFGRVDQRKSPGLIIKDAGTLVHRLRSSEVFTRSLDKLYTNTIAKLDERLGKRFGQVGESGNVIEEHYHTRLGDKITVGKEQFSIQEHLPSELALSLVDYMKGHHAAGEKVNHSFLERLAKNANDETAQRLIAKKMDQYLGNDPNSEESLSNLMRGLQVGAYKDQKVSAVYNILEETIQKAHKELPFRMGGQIVNRIQQTYNNLDQDQEEAIKGMLAASGYKADNIFKTLERGPGQIASQGITDISSKLGEKKQKEEEMRQRGYSRLNAA